MIDDTFQKLKSNLELTATLEDAVSRQHNAVRQVIENTSLGVKNTKLIGSLSRRTRIQPASDGEIDIDVLVVLGSFDHWALPGQGLLPGAVLDRTLKAVQESDRYAKMGPTQDHPTVAFTYANSVTVELVPAYVDNIGKSYNGTPHQPIGRAYWVPGRNGWELADYDHEAAHITAVNQTCKGLLVPTIKMLKALKREHFPSLKSHHLEIIAAEVVPGFIALYDSRGEATTYPRLIVDFLHRFESHLALPLRIPGSLSPASVVDIAVRAEVAGALPWLQRQTLAAWNANTDAEKHTLWKSIYGEVLPLP